MNIFPLKWSKIETFNKLVFGKRQRFSLKMPQQFLTLDNFKPFVVAKSP